MSDATLEAQVPPIDRGSITASRHPCSAQRLATRVAAGPLPKISRSYGSLTRTS